MPPSRRALLLGAICLALACGPAEAPAPPPPEVLVVEVAARDVPVISEWLGTTEGSVDAEIRAQVAGLPGLARLPGGLARQEGHAALPHRPAPVPGRARPGAGRPRPRRRPRSSSRASTWPATRRWSQSGRGEPPGVRHRAAAPALRARRELQSARAAVEKAKIELGFTEIRSPIDGIVGVAKRQLGDLVGPSDPSPLTSVSQLDPIRVSFQVSEQEYLRFAPRFQKARRRRAAFQRGRRRDGARRRQRLSAPRRRLSRRPRDRSAHGHDHRQGATSRTPTRCCGPASTRACASRPTSPTGALVVPQRAVQDLQGLAQLTLVGADDKVEVRTVTTGASWGTLQVITKGVVAGRARRRRGLPEGAAGHDRGAEARAAELAGAPPPGRHARPIAGRPATASSAWRSSSSGARSSRS